MAWQEAALIHENAAGVMLDVIAGNVVRVQYWNNTERAVLAVITLNDDKSKTVSVVAQPNTPVTINNIPPGWNNKWENVGFALSDV